MALDTQAYLKQADIQSLVDWATTDEGGKTWAQQNNLTTPDQVAQWHYDTYGKNESWRAAPMLPTSTPASPATNPPANTGLSSLSPGPSPTSPAAVANSADTLSQLSGNTGFSALSPNTTQASSPAQETAPWNLQTYLTAHPDVTDNYNNPNDRYPEVYGSIENYALAAAKVNGTPAEKAAALSYTPPTAYTPAAATPVTNGNYAQNQNAAQSGTYGSTGTTNTNQQQTTGQLTEQQQLAKTISDSITNAIQTTQQSQTGGSSTTSNQNTTGQSTTNANTTTTPTDTLGFGSLLQSQAPSAVANDTNRGAFLTDTMQTGGSQLGSQVDQAVRNSLTGTQMAGAGESAQARASGYAAAQIARQNLDQRLAASNQLAGPTAVQTLSKSADPYIGQNVQQTGTTNTTGNTTGTSNSTNFSDLVGQTNTASNTHGTSDTAQNTTGTTLGFNNLVGNTSEANSGSATSNSSQASAGLIPQSQQVASGGGGCVLCTAALELKLCTFPRILRKVIAYKLGPAWKNFRFAARGYFFLFTPVAHFLLGHPRLAKLLFPLAKMVVYEELRISGASKPFRIGAWSVHWLGHLLCSLIGRLPVPGHVTDSTILRLADKHQVNFKVGV